jgi:hypothetical protein
MTERYEVVFETAIYKSVFVEAESEDEAAEKALENFPPDVELPLPAGYDLNPRWFVEGVMAVKYDD